eukprot:6205965-Pleurochrysis_carterae.AAC.6
MASMCIVAWLRLQVDLRELLLRVVVLVGGARREVGKASLRVLIVVLKRRPHNFAAVAAVPGAGDVEAVEVAGGACAAALSEAYAIYSVP